MSDIGPEENPPVEDNATDVITPNELETKEKSKNEKKEAWVNNDPNFFGDKKLDIQRC